jgi:hypothetical protein
MSANLDKSLDAVIAEVCCFENAVRKTTAPSHRLAVDLPTNTDHVIVCLLSCGFAEEGRQEGCQGELLLWDLTHQRGRAKRAVGRWIWRATPDEACASNRRLSQ